MRVPPPPYSPKDRNNNLPLWLNEFADGVRPYAKKLKPKLKKKPVLLVTPLQRHERGSGKRIYGLYNELIRSLVEAADESTNKGPSDQMMDRLEELCLYLRSEWAGLCPPIAEEYEQLSKYMRPLVKHIVH